MKGKKKRRERKEKERERERGKKKKERTGGEKGKETAFKNIFFFLPLQKIAFFLFSLLLLFEPEKKSSDLFLFLCMARQLTHVFCIQHYTKILGYLKKNVLLNYEHPKNKIFE